MSEIEKILTLVVADALSNDEEENADSPEVVSYPKDDDETRNHVTGFGTTMKRDGWKEQLKMAGAVTSATSAGASNPLFGEKPKEEEEEDE